MVLCYRSQTQPGIGEGILSPISHLDCLEVRHSALELSESYRLGPTTPRTSAPGDFSFVPEPCAELGSGGWASEVVKMAETTLGLLAA